MTLAVVDLGLGNLGSVLQALRRAGGDPSLSSDPAQIAKADKIVLPGVAAFGLGIQRALNFRPALAAGKPLLGICLGMQLLFEEGEEDGKRAGLGLLPGRVTKIPSKHIPHIGWQKLEPAADSPLAPSGWAYFAHSYRCEAPREIVTATVEHDGVAIAAAVSSGTIFGVQYHPEKSAEDGEKLLRRFLQL